MSMEILKQWRETAERLSGENSKLRGELEKVKGELAEARKDTDAMRYAIKRILWQSLPMGCESGDSSIAKICLDFVGKHEAEPPKYTRTEEQS